MVALTCNPSTLGGRGGWITRSRDWDHPGQHGETPSLLKIQKISWARWHVHVIPATQEAEVGELPEPRRQRLQWAEITPLHSSLGNKSKTPSQKKKKILLLPHAVAYAYHPSTLGGWGRTIAGVLEFEIGLGNIARPHCYSKIQKLSRCSGVCTSHPG